MIEQTELNVNKWEYAQPQNLPAVNEHYADVTYLEIQRKSTSEKKGIACRFTCIFKLGDLKILEYVGQDSYVMDPEDGVDKKELLAMIRNSFSKFTDKFDLRKLGTVLQNSSLRPPDEAEMNLDELLARLQL
jgi:hypothetical protein